MYVLCIIGEGTCGRKILKKILKKEISIFSIKELSLSILINNCFTLLFAILCVCVFFFLLQAHVNTSQSFFSFWAQSPHLWNRSRIEF